MSGLKVQSVGRQSYEVWRGDIGAFPANTLFHHAFCSVIPGALSVAEVQQNVAHMSVKIPVELWSELKREKLLNPAAPTPN